MSFFETTPSDNTTTLTFHGRLVRNAAFGKLEEAVKEICNGRVSGEIVIFDLADVPAIDSSGIGILIAGHTASVKNEFKLYFRDLSERVLKVLRLTKLDEKFNITSSPTAVL